MLKMGLQVQTGFVDEVHGVTITPFPKAGDNCKGSGHSQVTREGSR